jgi:hypothetical protein
MNLAFSLHLLGACAASAQTSPQAPALQPADSLRFTARSSTVEYALYIGVGNGGGRTFATATRDVSGKNWAQFAERLGTARFPEYPRTEPAFFNWLASDGWELVECHRAEEVTGLLGDRDTVTRCHFRRAPSTPGTAGESRGGAAP